MRSQGCQRRASVSFTSPSVRKLSHQSVLPICTRILVHADYFRSCIKSETTSSMNGLSLAPTLALGK